jgi:DNA-nicking Smr family endonuclease
LAWINIDRMALKFKNGDPVRFLNDVGGGVVSHVDANGLVHVQTHDGFEIPVPSKELVHAGNFTLDHNEPEELPAPKEAVREKTMEPDAPVQKKVTGLPGNIPGDAEVNLLLGFVPENQGPVFSSSLACYLINDSPYFAYYSVGSWERGNFYHVAAGLIESQTKDLLAVFTQTNLSKISGIHIQLIWISRGRYSRKPALDEVVDIQMVNFSKDSYYHENAFFNDKAILFPVVGKDEWMETMENVEVSDKVKAVKEDQGSKSDQSRKRESTSDTMEIDLHMNEQEMQKTQFSLSGILALQMSRFHSALEEAVSKKFRRLVIIHGVGQGTLKMQIRKELQEKYPAYLFQDASFREYGFGATMVHLISDKKQ